ARRRQGSVIADIGMQMVNAGFAAMALMPVRNAEFGMDCLSCFPHLLSPPVVLKVGATCYMDGSRCRSAGNAGHCRVTGFLSKVQKVNFIIESLRREAGIGLLSICYGKQDKKQLFVDSI